MQCKYIDFILLKTFRFSQHLRQASSYIFIPWVLQQLLEQNYLSLRQRTGATLLLLLCTLYSQETACVSRFEPSLQKHYRPSFAWGGWQSPPVSERALCLWLSLGSSPAGDKGKTRVRLDSVMLNEVSHRKKKFSRSSHLPLDLYLITMWTWSYLGPWHRAS